MYHKHNTRGIVISSRQEDTDSKRVSLFTEAFGLLNARVQGSRNSRSKLRAGSQDFSLGEFSLVHGKSGWRVVGARSDRNLFEIFRNYPDKLKIVSNILNLIKKLVDEEESGSLFEIVSKFFGFLINAKDPEIQLAECLTLMRVLHSLGYMQNEPELSLPVSSAEIEIKDLEIIAPRRAQIVSLINASLKAA